MLNPKISIMKNGKQWDSQEGPWVHPAAIHEPTIVRESSAIISRHNVFCSCQAYYNSENSSPNRYCRNPTPAVV